MVLETSEDKIKQICDEISSNTLIPAKKKAQEIIEEARVEGKSIVDEAHKEKERLLESAQKQVTQKRNIAETSLNMAVKQCISKLKEDITQKLFSHDMQKLLAAELNKEPVVVKIIEAIIEAIRKEGLDADLSVAISSKVDRDQVYKLLASNVEQRIKQEQVFVGTFKAGAQIVIKEKNLSLEVTDEALKELLSAYVIKELKEKIFNL